MAHPRRLERPACGFEVPSRAFFANPNKLTISPEPAWILVAIRITDLSIESMKRRLCLPFTPK